MKNLILSFFVALVSSLAAAQLNSKAPRNPSPEGLYTPKRYDGNGKVSKVTGINPAGTVSSMIHYNEEGMPILVRDYATFTYSYSNDKRRVTLNKSRGQGKTVWELDDKGRITTMDEQNADGENERRLAYTYNEKGLLTQVETLKRSQVRKGHYSLNSDNVVTYTYDDQGRVAALKAKHYGYTYDYRAKGSDLEVVISNAREPIMSYRYDKNGRLLEYISFMSGGGGTTSTYELDKQGNVVMKTTMNSGGGLQKTEAFIISYADGKVGSPKTMPLKLVNVSQNNKVYTLLKAPFQSASGFVDKGKLNGPGMLASFGDVYQGDFVNGEETGFGVMGQAKMPGVELVGEFKQGKLNGLGIVSQENVIIAAGMYANGVLKKDMLAEYKAGKYADGCTGNCVDGFGRKFVGGSDFFSFYKNGKPVGIYIKKGSESLERGLLTEDQHFQYLSSKTKMRFGYNYNKKAAAKILIIENGSKAGLYQNDHFVEEYPIVEK